MIDHLKEVAWPFFLVLLFIASLFLIFASQIGFKLVFRVCLGFAVIAAILFINDTPDRIIVVWNAQIIRTYLFKILNLQ